MTNAEAIETLRANYPDACYEQLREAVDAAIEALKAQNAAGDTISRQDAIDAMRSLCDCDKENPYRENPHIDAVIDALENLSAVQPEHKTGHWLLNGERYGVQYYRCSECEEEEEGFNCAYMNYCPNCGADMRGERNG